MRWVERLAFLRQRARAVLSVRAREACAHGGADIPSPRTQRLVVSLDVYLGGDSEG